MPPRAAERNVSRGLPPAAGAVVAGLALAPLVPLLLAVLTGGDPGAILLGSAAFAVTVAGAVERISATYIHGRLGPANALTMARGAGAAVVLGLALAPEQLEGARGWAAAAGVAALLALDGVDGWLARRSGLASDFGARFDMEVDALLLLALSALACSTGRAGAWVLLLGLLRYAFAGLGRLRPRFARRLPPSRRRRAVCAVVIGLLAALLAPPLTPPASTWIAAAALGLLAWSFARDLAWLARQPA